MNKCKIEKCSKNNEEIRYWCLNHKDFALSDLGECNCQYKEIYDNKIIVNPKEIFSLKIIYPNILNSLNAKVYLNGIEENNALQIEESLLDYKDIGGLMIAKLNNINLENSYCTYCGKPHTDDGKFAYTPHSKHLCQYCGAFYKVEKSNIGNEFSLYLNIPNISLENNCEKIEDKIFIEYDVLNGKLLINDNNVDKIKINNQVIELKEYLNKIFKEEY